MFAVYDFNATIQQKNSNKLQIWIFVLGAVATALALSQTQFKNFFQYATLQNGAISIAILIVPITVSVLVAARNQFKFGVVLHDSLGFSLCKSLVTSFD
jgi:hypothetical protein